MNKAKKWFASLLAMTLAAAMGMSMAACGDKDPNPGPGPEPELSVGISIAAGAPLTIKYGETVTLSVSVTNATDKTYTWSVEDEKGDESDILAVSNENVVSVTRNVSVDSVVTVRATSNADKTKSATHTFTVKPNLDGSVGELTADMFAELEGDNLTVSGTVSDVYVDLNNSYNSTTTVYNSTVMMDTNAWYGAFSRAPQGGGDGTEDLIADNYRMGEKLKDPYSGHALNKVYIDRHNEPVSEVQTDYLSVPLTWESQHLWNHLSGLGTDISNKFTYDSTNDEYVYSIENSGPYDTDYSEDEYLMIYLAHSLTPMLEENFMEFRLKVTDGHITGIWAQTLVVNTYADDGETVTAYGYTEVELTISDVGTTKVPEPAPYEAPENVELLQKAIEQMQTANNYTFKAVEHAVSSPEPDAGDYTTDALTVAPLAEGNDYYQKHTQASGTVGTVGYVTPEAAIFETTGKYNYSDGNSYYVGYTGYKQCEGYYEVLDDKQVYTSVKGLIGVQRKNGNFMEDAMPQFDFSPNVFEFATDHRVSVNGTYYTAYDFVLRDPAATNEMAKQISAHGYAEDGAEAAFSTLTITVIADRNTKEFVSLYSTEFPYDVTFGTYVGYVETIFSNFGTTQLKANAFDEGNYTPRAWRAEWTDYTCHDFTAEHDSQNDKDENALTVLQHMFGNENAAKLPKPELFMNAFVDDINGPWFDFSESATAQNGYVECFSFNFQLDPSDPRLDKNGRIADIEALLGADGEMSDLIITEAALGYQYSLQNSGYRTAGNPESSYFATYINPTAGILISIESNHTANLFFEIYRMGEWTLSKS